MIQRNRVHDLLAALIVLVPMLLIQPFSWPVQGDRAFLIYMSQVVARGEPLYAATPFGYPPLASLLGGGWIWLVDQVSGMPGYLSLRWLGLICYPLTGGAIFRLISTLTPKRHLALIGVILYAGFGMPMMIGCINVEPKILVVLFATLGMTAALRQRWLPAGIFAGLCLISWQPAGLYGAAMALVALSSPGQRRWKALGRLIAGGTLGVSILFIYLAITDTWQPAWNQLIVKHLANEASRLGESPFSWVSEITRGFLTEVLHFVSAGVGLVLAIISPRKTPFR
ncbi:MAG: glycosyltransferase family 39 protein, partial [Saprospiraceae bacterium]|nr:glycosyltransferase family 39 protein [Saprospiraceae bacterium]